MIIDIFPSGPLLTNAYLLGCEKTKRAVIIDAPMNCQEDVLTAVRSKELKVDAILLTHSHWDHIADVKTLRDQLHVSVYVHKEDAKNLEIPGTDQLPLMVPIAGIKADHFLEEGQRIDVGNLSLEVLHTPGHSPGCVCFYLARESVLFSGDTLFRGAIGNTQFPTSSSKQMRASLKRLASLPKETKVFPGHGEETTIGTELYRS